MNDCYDISILPNYKEQCWLNTILMCVLYSQYSRNMLINDSIHWKDDVFLNIIRNIINSYYSNKKDVDNFYKSITPAKLLYEIVIEHNKVRDLKFTEYNILDFYRFLKIKCVDVIYTRNKYFLNYLSKKPYSGNEPPKVVVLFHEELTNISKLHSFSKNSSGSGSGSGSNSKFILDSRRAGTISTYADEIEFFGTTYVLSSCVVNDNDMGYRYHTIAGIICNDKKMVYNSYINKEINPCSLIKFDWDVRTNQELCINPYDCELSFKYNIKKIKDLCFSFGSGNRYLVYIRKDTINVSDIILKREEIKEPKSEPVIQDINDEIKKVKELSDIGLYNQIELINNSPINIKKIKDDYNRNELEKFVLEYRLKSLPKVKEVIAEKIPSVKEEPPQPPEVPVPVPVPVPDPVPVPVPSESRQPTVVLPVPEQIEEIKVGGVSTKTKKDLIIAINKKLNSMKKNNLICLYTNLLSNS